MSLRGFLYPYSKGKDLLNTFYINHFKLYLIMKKILLLSALAGGIATGAQAQQLPNVGFENWKGRGNCGQTIQASTTTSGGPTDKETLQKRPGDEPTDWNGTSVRQKVFMEATAELIFKKNDTAHGNYASLVNKYVSKYGIGANAPAYLTFGQPWSYAATANQDGGTVGGMAFSHKPDAIKGDFKRTLSTEKPNELAHIIVYLWNGTFTSKIGKEGGDAKMIVKDNVDRAVLGKSNAGEVTGNGKLIAQCDYAFQTTKNSDWETITVPIEYKDGTATPTMMNVIISSADYWTRGNIGKENQLDVDNVEFIYYHALTSFTYDGVTKNIAEGQTEIDFSNTTYDANKTLSYIKKGVGATVVKSYNEADATLTIEVQGNDYSSNPNSKTTYTVKFAKPVPTTGKLSSLVVNGSEVLKANQFYYTVYGEYNAQSIQWTAEDGDLAKVTSNYDENSRTAKVSVNAGQNTNTYSVKFAKKGTSYTSSVMIAMGPIFLGAPVQAVEITPLTPYNTVDLQLMNFSLDGGNTIVGNIFVENVPYQKLPNGDVQLNTTIKDFKIFGDAAQDINSAIKSLTLNGVLSNNDLAATITIDLDGTPIMVKVASTSSKYVDATGITGFNFSVVRDALTNPNALIYADADATGAGANDIVAGNCTELNLTEAQPFNAPTAFTATTVNYDREFTTTANYISSFVLPYSMNVSDVQGEVYEFASVEANTINFKKATTVEANKPYLIVATAANPFKATNVKVEATPAAMETVNGDYAHVGTYTKQEIISDATTTYYGYANGQFVKANTGTLNPFRTMIKATNTAAPTTLSLKLDGEVTGIVGVNSELGKVNVYNLEGKLVRSQVAAATALQGLAKGVYVINGKKVVK